MGSLRSESRYSENLAYNGAAGGWLYTGCAMRRLIRRATVPGEDVKGPAGVRSLGVALPYTCLLQAVPSTVQSDMRELVLGAALATVLSKACARRCLPRHGIKVGTYLLPAPSDPGLRLLPTSRSVN